MSPFRRRANVSFAKPCSMPAVRIPQAGVERILIWTIRKMRGDKIAVIRCCLADRTDPQTARFLDWERTHPRQP
jgi:hypothetical protein